MKSLNRIFFLLFLALKLNRDVSSQFVETWVSESSPLENIWLKKKSMLLFLPDNLITIKPQYTITIDPSRKYQQMDGFGTALTDSSCWLLKYMLSPSKSNETLEKLFTSNGINLSLLRHSIGSSDYSWEPWTLNDLSKLNEDDFDLKNFSMWRENAYISPVLNKIMQLGGKRVKIISTLFSPPAWMKSKRNLIGSIGGSLRPECYTSFTKYIIRYLNESERRNAPIYALSIQNQPWSFPSEHAGMPLKIEEQLKIIDFLSLQLTSAGLKTKIVAYDHSFDVAKIEMAKTLLKTNRFLSGTALQASDNNNYDVLSQLHADFPQMDILITKIEVLERCNFLKFISEMQHLIRAPRNWAKGVVLGVLALDQSGGPCLIKDNMNDTLSNQGLFTIRLSSNIKNSIEYGTGYYSLGHSSKFIDPGAFRVDTNQFDNEIENVAYLNPDQSLVIVMVNLKLSNQMVKIKLGAKAVFVNMPKLSGLTMKWIASVGSIFKKNVFIVAKANDKFVSLKNDPKVNKILKADKDGKFGAEVFEIVNERLNMVTIKCVSSKKFVRVDLNGILLGDQDKVTDAEVFEIVFFKEGTFALKSRKFQKYVGADNFGLNPLIANRAKIDESWDDFYAVDVI